VFKVPQQVEIQIPICPIAVCLAGGFRFLGTPAVYQSYRRAFDYKPHCTDFYVVASNEPGGKNSRDSREVSENYTMRYNTVPSWEANTDWLKYLNPRAKLLKTKSNFSRMPFWRYEECFKFFEAAENGTGMKYKYLAITRPDLLWWSPLRDYFTLADIDLRKIENIPGPHLFFGTRDYLFSRRHDMPALEAASWYPYQHYAPYTICPEDDTKAKDDSAMAKLGHCNFLISGLVKTAFSRSTRACAYILASGHMVLRTRPFGRKYVPIMNQEERCYARRVPFVAAAMVWIAFSTDCRKCSKILYIAARRHLY
jgi:hypothetical protein